MEITIKTLAGAALLPWMIGTKWFAFKDAILHAVLSGLTTRVRPDAAAVDAIAVSLSLSFIATVESAAITALVT